MFCSLANANAVTAVIVLGSCEFCQVRIMNMQNKGEISPNTQLFSMFSICQIRLKEKKTNQNTQKEQILIAFWDGKWDSSEVPWGVAPSSSKPHL